MWTAPLSTALFRLPWVQLLLRPIKDRTSGVSHTDEIFRVKAEGWGSRETGDTDTAEGGQSSQAHVKWSWKVALCGVRRGQACWEPWLESHYQSSPGHLVSSCNTAGSKWGAREAERHTLRLGFLETAEHSLLWYSQPAGTHCRDTLQGHAAGRGGLQEKVKQSLYKRLRNAFLVQLYWNEYF